MTATDYSKEFRVGEEPDPHPAPRQYPEPAGAAAFHGPMGDLTRVIEPHTEADPVAILSSALVMFGSVIGRGPFYLAEADRHHTNLDLCLVGATAKGRKGTSLGRTREMFLEIDPAWNDNIKGGLSSGEGLIHAVRDGDDDLQVDGDGEEDHQDQGVTDKRLLLVESEFASVLKVMMRDGNTLSGVIRQAWDTGNLNTLTKQKPTRATDGHISIIGHVTASELLRYLDRTEAGNGFANRILWLCVRRSRLLPFGGSLRAEDLSPVREALAKSVRFARELGQTRLDFDHEARNLWADVYEDLSEADPGMLGAVTSRAEAQTVRLALIYALGDRCRTIGADHLRAALALWDYSLRSAGFIFGDTLGDPLADELLRLLRQAAAEGLDREAIRDALGRHRRSPEITRGLELLAQHGLARMERRETGGRPAEVWFAGARYARKARKGLAEIPAAGLTAHTALTAQGAVVLASQQTVAHTYRHNGKDYRPGDTLPDGRLVESIEDGIPVLVRPRPAAEPSTTPADEVRL